MILEQQKGDDVEKQDISEEDDGIGTRCRLLDTHAEGVLYDVAHSNGYALPRLANLVGLTVHLVVEKALEGKEEVREVVYP